MPPAGAIADTTRTDRSAGNLACTSDVTKRGRERRESCAFSVDRREAERALAARVIDPERARKTLDSKMLFGAYATQWRDSREATGENRPQDS